MSRENPILVKLLVFLIGPLKAGSLSSLETSLLPEGWTDKTTVTRK